MSEFRGKMEDLVDDVCRGIVKTCSCQKNKIHPFDDRHDNLTMEDMENEDEQGPGQSQEAEESPLHRS